MAKLTDTQRVILSAAAQPTDCLTLPLPRSLKGGASHKVVNALVEKGLIKEVKANRKLGDPVWRDSEEGHGLALIITDAGLDAIGVEVDPPKSKTTKAEQKAASQPTPAERKTREGTKQALVIEMLRRPEGASIPEIVEATGWASHTIRGLFAGALKRKLCFAIDSAKDELRGRVYRLA